VKDNRVRMVATMNVQSHRIMKETSTVRKLNGASSEGKVQSHRRKSSKRINRNQHVTIDCSEDLEEENVTCCKIFMRRMMTTTCRTRSGVMQRHRQMKVAEVLHQRNRFRKRTQLMTS
jgi:hypothetical protein